MQKIRAIALALSCSRWLNFCSGIFLMYSNICIVQLVLCKTDQRGSSND